MTSVAFSPGVSVIMPCHNAARTIEEAIRSVLAQTCEDWELIVVNDGSTDESPKILQRFEASDSRIRVIHNARPSGASAARNIALAAATRRYIAFLDSDDLWLPHKLEVQLGVMRNNEVALCCGWYDTIDGEGRMLGSVRSSPGIVTHRTLLFDCVVGCLTAMLDRTRTGEVRFDSRLQRGEDYHLWLNVLKNGSRGYLIGETLARYRVHGNTLSSNKLSQAKTRWRVYRFEGHGILESAFYFVAYAVTGVLKSLSMRSHRARQPLARRTTES